MQREGGQELSVVLYQTLGCHLCEEALVVMNASRGLDGVVLQSIDIADDDGLLARYGTRIPVLHRVDTGAELDWPFTSEEVARFLDGQPA